MPPHSRAHRCRWLFSFRGKLKESWSAAGRVDPSYLTGSQTVLKATRRRGCFAQIFVVSVAYAYQVFLSIILFGTQACGVQSTGALRPGACDTTDPVLD